MAESKHETPVGLGGSGLFCSGFGFKTTTETEVEDSFPLDVERKPKQKKKKKKKKASETIIRLPGGIEIIIRDEERSTPQPGLSQPRIRPYYVGDPPSHHKKNKKQPKITYNKVIG